MIDKIPPFVGRGIVPLPVIPTEYTDALSYGEQVGTMIHKLDETVDKVNEVVDDNNEFKADLTEQQNDFETSITNQQNTFETNITNQQNTYEQNTTSELNTWKTNTETGLNTWKNETKGEFQTQINGMENEWDNFLDDYEREYGVTQVLGNSELLAITQKGISDVVMGNTNVFGGKDVFPIKKWLDENEISYEETANGLEYTATVTLYNNPFLISNDDIPLMIDLDFEMTGTNLRFEVLDSGDNVVFSSLSTEQYPVHYPVYVKGNRIRMSAGSFGDVVLKKSVWICNVPSNEELNELNHGNVYSYDNNEFNYQGNFLYINPIMFANHQYKIGLQVTWNDASSVALSYATWEEKDGTDHYLIEPSTSLIASVKNGDKVEFLFTPNADCYSLRLRFNTSYVDKTNVSHWTVQDLSVTKYFSRAEAEELILNNYGTEILPINVFGDVLPEKFKDTLNDFDKDILIACTGDSITALVGYCDLNSENISPFSKYNSWVSQLQEKVSKTKPVYHRLDDTDFFTKDGSWNAITGSQLDENAIVTRKFNNECSDTYICTNSSCYIQFETGDYEKSNIFVDLTPSGKNTEIAILEGNGKMLASLDRVNWVEANGFTFDQRTNRSNQSEETLNANGIATFCLQRRIYLKKAVEGNFTVKYMSSVGGWMCVWGVEQYNGNAILFDNIGRGGMDSVALYYSSSDVIDRSPDLILFELPFANDVRHYLSTTEGALDNLFGSSNEHGYYAKTNGYTDIPILFVMPHGRGEYFDDNNNSIVYAQSPDTVKGYDYCKRAYGHLKTLLGANDNVGYINLYDQLLYEATKYGMKYNKAFGGYYGAFTKDGVHLNQKGANHFVKYLTAVFNN